MHYGVLGPLAVTDDEGVDHTPKGARQRLLLATLVCAGGAVVSVDRLAEALWGEDLPDDPSAALQNQVSRLRRLLGGGGEPPVQTVNQGYRLAVDPDQVDSARFERLLVAAEEARARDAQGTLSHLARALALWRGEAYGDMSDQPGLQAEASRLEDLRARATERYGETLLDLGRSAEAVTVLEALAAAHPLREGPQHQLLRALYTAGRQTEALAAYQAYRRRLGDELGLEPSPELTALESQILRHELILPRTGSNGPAVPFRRAPHPPPTSFVGRENDLAGVMQRLEAARLLTICGTGGVGKTRLALEVATRVTPRYTHGVHVVELASLAAGGDVAAALASALQVPRRVDVSLTDRLVEVLAGKRLLLVLDNCEHVLDGAAATLDPILAGTDQVDVLATSRAALAVDGEHVWPLAPLETEGAASPAVRLFTERARAADPGVVLDDGDPLGVERLCRRLDGIPLALELAAARLRVASLAEVDAAVGARPDLLTGGRRTAQARHRSLDALVEWSYQLLSTEERLVFARLSVFQDSFDLDDATAVTAGDGITPERVPTLVWALVDQSLVSPQRGEPGRYSMLDTLRRAALQRLVAEGADSQLRGRHAELVLIRAAEAAAAMHGPGAAAAMANLDQLLPELRGARRHLEETDDLDGQLRLSDSLFWYGYSGIRSEVMTWTTATARRAAEQDHPLVPSVMAAAAVASWQHGDHVSARTFAESGVAAARRLGDPPGSDRAFRALSEVTQFQGDVDRARQLSLEAVSRTEGTGRALDVVYALTGQALSWAYGDQPRQGLPSADRALSIAAACGSPIAVAWAAYTAGEIRLETDPQRALELLDEAVIAANEVGERMVAGVAAVSSLTLRSRLGLLGSDLSGYGDLLEHWRHVGAWTPQWTTLRNLIEVLARRGEEVVAARLFGASEISTRASRSYGVEAQRLERTADTLRWRLGERFEAEVETGRQLGDEAALALALEVVRRFGPT